MKTTHTYKTRTFLLLPKKEPTYQSINEKTLSATDVLAPTTMKNAAKCDTSCELRNPVSHQNFERILHFLRGVCLLECLFIPTSPNFLVWCTCVDCWFCHEIITLRWTHEVYFIPFMSLNTTVRSGSLWGITNDTTSKRKFYTVWFDFTGNQIHNESWSSDRTSNQSRIPAEFKHITRRRKRN